MLYCASLPTACPLQPWGRRSPSPWAPTRASGCAFGNRGMSCKCRLYLDCVGHAKYWFLSCLWCSVHLNTLSHSGWLRVCLIQERFFPITQSQWSKRGIWFQHWLDWESWKCILFYWFNFLYKSCHLHRNVFVDIVSLLIRWHLFPRWHLSVLLEWGHIKLCPWGGRETCLHFFSDTFEIVALWQLSPAAEYEIEINHFN